MSLYVIGVATATSCHGEHSLVLVILEEEEPPRVRVSASKQLWQPVMRVSTTTTLRLALEIHMKHTQERAGQRRSSILPQWRLLKQRKSDQFEVLFSLLMLLPV